MNNYIDVHSHLHDKAYDLDRGEVLVAMKESGVSTITIGTDQAESISALNLALTHDNIWCAIGQHPVDRKEEIFDASFYTNLIEKGNGKIVAFGEIGLDYFRLDSEQDKVDEKKRQYNLFEAEIECAMEHNLPLMLHGRPSAKSMDAYEDMCDMLEAKKKIYGDKLRGNFHFFVGDTHIAKRVLDLGFTMSFSGVITFAKEYEEVVRSIPDYAIHAETDSPYASPTPYRGKRNSPVYVREVVRSLAAIRNVEEIVLARALQENARRVFGLPA